MFPEFQEYVNQLDYEMTNALAAYEGQDLPYHELMEKINVKKYVAMKRQKLCSQIYSHLTPDQKLFLSEIYSNQVPGVPALEASFPVGKFGNSENGEDIFHEFLEQALPFANDEILRNALEATKAVPRAFDNFSVSEFPWKARAEEIKTDTPITAKLAWQIRQDVEKTAELIRDDPYNAEHSSYVNDLSRAFNRQRHKEMIDAITKSDDESFKALFTLQEHAPKPYAYSLISFIESVPSAETWQNARQKHTFQMSPELRNIYEKVFDEIDKMQVVPENETFGRSAITYYINDGLMKARTDIDRVMNSKDPFDLDKLEELNAQYEAEYNKLHRLYEVGEALLGTEHAGFPDNIDNQRNNAFPVEFKKNIKVNACLNSIAMTHTLLRWAGVSREEFFANPVEAMHRFEDAITERQGFDAKIKDKPLGSLLAEMSNADIDISRQNDLANIMRPIEGMNSMEPDRKLAAQNGLTEVMLDHHIRAVSLDVQLFGAYFKEEIEHAASALFILPEKEIDFRALAKKTPVDPKTMTKAKPFELAPYLASHDVDFTALNGRIKGTLCEYIQNGGSSDGFKKLVNGAIRGVEQALLAKQPNMNDPTIQALVQFCNEPNAYVRAAAQEKGLRTMLLSATPKTFTAAQKEFKAAQKAQEKDRKTFLKAEKAYNKQATKLQKEIAKQQKIYDKAMRHDKMVAAQKAIELRTQELEALKTNELEALKAAANGGLVTATYYEQRKKDVVGNRQNRQPSMYVKGLCDKASFLKEKMNGFSTKAEALEEYNALKAQEKVGQMQHDYKLFSGMSFIAEIEAVDNPPKKRNSRPQKTERTQVSLGEELSAQKGEAEVEEVSQEAVAKFIEQYEKEVEQKEPVSPDVIEMISREKPEEVAKEDQPEVVDFNGLL
ncbi:MAG: hypothetical protein IJX49_01285 [Clostridia bacterium]|nr:hypothetical protein [Clostridia bacterium]